MSDGTVLWGCVCVCVVCVCVACMAEVVVCARDSIKNDVKIIA